MHLVAVFQYPQRLASVQIPQSQCVVIGGRERPLAVRREATIHHLICMTSELAYLCGMAWQCWIAQFEARASQFPGRMMHYSAEASAAPVHLIGDLLWMLH